MNFKYDVSTMKNIRNKKQEKKEISKKMADARDSFKMAGSLSSQIYDAGYAVLFIFPLKGL